MGSKGVKRSEETKQKIRNKLSGVKFDDLRKKNISRALKGRKLSKEHVENIRKVRTGWRLNETTKNKISKKLKGNKNSVGHGHAPNKKSIDALVAYTKKNGAWNKGLKGFGAGEKHHWFGKDNSKENNPTWIKDRSKIKQGSVEKRSPKYKDWRRAICDRDNWRCLLNSKDCNGKLEVHHILGWTNNPELRYKINNGITLCHAHHPRKREDEKRLIPTFQKLIK